MHRLGDYSMEARRKRVQRRRVKNRIGSPCACSKEQPLRTAVSDVLEKAQVAHVPRVHHDRVTFCIQTLSQAWQYPRSLALLPGLANPPALLLCRADSRARLR